jgi:hypothetical protein
MESGGFEYSEWNYGDEDDRASEDRSAGPTVCSVCETEPTTFAFQFAADDESSLGLPDWIGLCRVCSDLIATDQLAQAVARLAPDSPIGGSARERGSNAMSYLAPLVRRYRPRR